jgi:protein SCO1
MMKREGERRSKKVIQGTRRLFAPSRLRVNHPSREGAKARRIFAVLMFGLLACVTAREVAAQSSSIPDVGIDQRLNNQVPLDLSFRDESGRVVKLREYFNGKPVLLTPVYFSCPMLCSQVLYGVNESLSDMRFSVGQEFNVLTVSFDPRDTPQLAAQKKAEQVRHYGRAGASDGWHFLTGDETSIKRLMDAVGFRYKFDPETNQFAHGAGVMVLTPDGKVARYFYGIQYPPRDLRLGLVEASADRIGSPVDQVLLLCYHYDPVTGKYSAVTMNFVRLGGALTLALLGGFVFVMLRRERARRGVEKESGVVAARLEESD